MRFTYVLHPLIGKDFDAGYSWYEGKQKGLGERFLKSISIKIDEITNYPEIFGSRAHKTYREAKVDNFPYLIVFKINKRKKEIYIVSIHHTSKKPHKKYRK
jgi:hypothetical protein